MKKAIMMLVLLAAPFALQAQTKFHDVELNEANGPVKSITQSGMMGRGEQVVNFTQDGKMQAEGLSGLVYDENGYLQSIVSQIGGKKTITNTTFIWEDGRVKTQIATRKNKKVITTNVYDDRGILVRQIIEQDGQVVTYDYYDIQLDDHGNWTSRKTKVAGIEIIYPRTIQYY
jgi:antitoxin component YwqK of YwqJK toxin-antitoxin module